MSTKDYIEYLNGLDLTKKEKDSAKETVAAASIVEKLKSLNSAGK